MNLQIILIYEVPGILPSFDIHAPGYQNFRNNVPISYHVTYIPDVIKIQQYMAVVCYLEQRSQLNVHLSLYTTLEQLLTYVQERTMSFNKVLTLQLVSSDSNYLTRIHAHEQVWTSSMCGHYLQDLLKQKLLHLTVKLPRPSLQIKNFVRLSHCSTFA